MRVVELPHNCYFAMMRMEMYQVAPSCRLFCSQLNISIGTSAETSEGEGEGEGGGNTNQRCVVN